MGPTWSFISVGPASGHGLGCRRCTSSASDAQSAVPVGFPRTHPRGEGGDAELVSVRDGG